jgi:hypothetical protein
LIHRRLAQPVGTSTVWRLLLDEATAVNSSDQSKSASTHFHSEMQRALRRQGLSEVTRDSYSRALRWLQAQVDVPLDQFGVLQFKDCFRR